jgi:glutaredoxin
MRLFALIILIATGAALQTSLADEVHRWVDEEGRVHFSNQPGSGSDNDTNETHDWTDVRGRKTYSDRSPDQIRTERRRLMRDIECMSGLTEIIYSPQKPSRSEVVLLTARWCETSRPARQYLKKNKIRFVEYDIDRSARGRTLYLSLSRKGVPVLLAGKRQMFGFRADLAESMLQQTGHLGRAR